LPELPWQRREKYLKDFGIKEQDADAFVNNIELGKFFEAVIAGFKGNKDLAKLASNYIASDMVGFMSKDFTLKYPRPEKFAKIIVMVSEGKLGSRAAKDLVERLLKSDIDPEEVANKEGLIQKNDESAVKDLAVKLIVENPKVVADYKAGKEIALMFFVGQIMKATKGSSNPQVIKKVLIELLS
jgi:aspartyl-tRNA(Asn)/glutamyl-tRNA(Gln) amidotransferase subunit B